MSTDWVPRPTDDGSWTLEAVELGEACHSLAGAWQQARERYARGCRLGERGREHALRERLALLDVGTGLGLNLAAALAELDGTRTALHALTLERSPEVIAAGCDLYDRPELRAGPWEPWHAPVRAALRRALAAPGTPVDLGGRGTLTLRLGDARLTLEAADAGPFDAVFLDPFSPRRAPELWEEPFLAAIARRMAPGSWLATYSAAFRVRLGLARAGLRVGQGPRVGAKGEGTLAGPDVSPPELPSRLRRRLARRCAQGAPAPSLPHAGLQPAFLGFRLRDPARGID